MEQQTLINNIRRSSAAVLDLIEQAQALAAAQVQEYVKVGGATFLSGFDYTDYDIDADDVANGVSSMQNAMPDLLGANGTNLYILKS